jgi:hypothetical protein
MTSHAHVKLATRQPSCPQDEPGNLPPSEISEEAPEDFTPSLV